MEGAIHQGATGGACISKGDAQNTYYLRTYWPLQFPYSYLRKKLKQEEEKYKDIHNDKSNMHVTPQVYIEPLAGCFIMLK